MSCWMSSSRVHTTLTGPSTCLAMRTAATTMSGSSLRPKPPPSRCLWTVTFSTGRPAAFAASDCTRVMIWVPIQISQESGLRCTVQFIGSIVAWARNGSS